MIQMIKLKQTGGPFGDATCNYEVVIENHMTVRDFIAEVLKNEREWGDIYVGKNLKRQKVCEYINGHIISMNETVDTSNTVKGGWANGGWSAMSYYLEVGE